MPAARRKDPDWSAKWIWLKGSREEVNCHVLFRHTFDCPDDIKKAVLRITAYSSYRVWLNGTFIGRGPVPCDPAWQFYDEYGVAGSLKAGRNTIAVLAHNFAQGTHNQQPGPGGLLCQMEIRTAEGRIRVCSNGAWKVRRSERYARNSPRCCWSAGFAETTFLDKDAGWELVGFDDTGWETAVELGEHPAYPWERLLPRPIPQFSSEWLPAVGCERGESDPSGLHAVSFSELVPAGGTGIAYAATWLEVDQGGEYELRFDSDDASAVFINGERAFCTTINENFVRTRNWVMRDECHQFHYGAGNNGIMKFKVTLRSGWNRVVVAEDLGPGAWGFTMGFLPPSDASRFDTRNWLRFAARVRPESQAPLGWELSGPLPTTGFNDSLNEATAEPDSRAPRQVLYDSSNYNAVTDYAVLMLYERRGNIRAAAEALPVTLRSGEFAILDLGRAEIGFPELTLIAEENAIVDVGFSLMRFPDHRIRFMSNGFVKYVDRLYARNGEQTWMPVLRRVGRYVHLVCRRGAMRITRAGMHTWHIPTRKPAAFACSDKALNSVYEVSVRSARILMQDTWQDCSRREEGTVNTQSFNYASIGMFLALGEESVTRHTMRTIIRTQERSGWFDSHGLSGWNNDEVTECLMYHLWVRDWFRETADAELVKELYPCLMGNLNYFLKMINAHGLIDGRNRHTIRTGEMVYIIDNVSCGGGIQAYANFGKGSYGELSGYNVLFAAAAQALSELAPVAGYPEKKELYERIAARTRRSLDERFWDEKRTRYGAVRNDSGITEEYHPALDLMALYHGTCPEQRCPHLVETISRRLGPDAAERPDYPLTVLGHHHLIAEVLFRYGRDREAIEFLRRCFGRWVQMGMTTVAEGYRLNDLKEGVLPYEYEIHAYGLGALAHFHRNILGVQPLEPGYAKVLLAPHVGDLAWARGGVHTPLGMIKVDWKCRNGSLDLNVVLPKGCAWDVVLPKELKAGAIRVINK